jgi:hypothetical protein
MRRGTQADGQVSVELCSIVSAEAADLLKEEDDRAVVARACFVVVLAP